ncbi:inactivation-no-after-potential D protein isoform X2 [Uranotaenia lowii]|uniref:inactivation-no-after-potential D protein isoform X2 n=1 Tax=Uranotaenia lowii TaxID=190385 RepID=UPI00247999AA|nr:inactivation-no-after-potential D protein isoform X2 [Uranotaenia lowii]
MIRLTSYSSENSLIYREINNYHQNSPQKRFLKYVTTNECNNIFVLENVAFNQKLVKLLYTKFRQNLYNGRYMSTREDISQKRKSASFYVHTQLRKEYYNDIDICLKDFGQLAQKVDKINNDDPSLECQDNEEHSDYTISPDNNDNDYIAMHVSTVSADMLSSTESTIFLDAIDAECTQKSTQEYSDDDTMKSMTKTSNSRISLESAPSPQCGVAASVKEPSRSNMTVMTIEHKDVISEKDWGKEREVIIERDENKSFGISIVGGTVNVSDDTIVSGIFIKNIIPNSPADKCGILKIGDRILAVDGTDIRTATHEHAMKTIKNAGNSMILQVQSLTKKIEDYTESSALLKKIPPPITPCKTPELELIHDGKQLNSTEMIDEPDNKLKELETNQNNNVPVIIEVSTATRPESQNAPATESENSSDDEDGRDLEGKTHTKAGLEIDRASAGNIKRSKEEIALDSEEEDAFGYTAKKIKKRYGSLGQVLCYSIERSCGGSLGISLAGHRDRTKMASFIAGINPKGIASSAFFEVGDEILEVNGVVLHGRSHLNVPVIIKGLVGSTLTFVLLRKKDAKENLAVKPVTQFPVSIDEEEIFSTYKNMRTVSVKKGSSGLGIMIIEGKHSEVGQGIFISDIQEGSMADKAGLNIGEMILAVNKDSLIGCTYETAASLLKRAEGVVTLKICNPNKTKEPSEPSSANSLDPKTQGSVSGKSSPANEAETKKGSSRPVTPKPQASPAKEVVDPSKAEIVADDKTTIELNADKKPLGIVVVGGCDSCVNTGAVIVDILPNSVASSDKRLQILDQILEINNIKITSEMTERQIQKALKQIQTKVRMVVYRASKEETEKIEIDVPKKSGKYLGVGFRANHPKGVIITDILPGGIMESDGRIHKGDIITHVNSDSLSNTSYEDCSVLFKTAQSKITLTILRPCPKKRSN